MGGALDVREISLGDGFGDVAVKANGARVLIHSDGRIESCTAGATSAPSTSGTAPQIGDKMPDGTICAGLSPETGGAMYIAAADAPLTMTWTNAMSYAASLDACGHQDWGLPTKDEMRVLFNNRAAIGGFDERGGGLYWSSTEVTDYPANAWIVRFSSGRQYWGWKGLGASVRVVRS